MGGHYGGYGGPRSTGFGGLGGAGGLGAGCAGVGGLGDSGGGLGDACSLYSLPSSGGMQAGGYPGGGHYSLLASSGYQNQHHLPAGASSPVPRVPPGSM
ncbi:RNA-binding [Sesbania bispinosa]|nr:RNA-binding [Sesbania bispinosa]